MTAKETALVPAGARLPRPSRGHGPAAPALYRRGGSVLLETILVLPILLMLLGGLFVIGDLHLGRLASQELDRALAWRAVERFSYRGTEETKFNEAAFTHIIGPHGITPDPGPDIYAFRVNPGDMNNSWTTFYAGRADVQVDLPWWVSMVNAQEAVMGDHQNPDFMDSSFKLNSVDDEFTLQARSYVLRRHENQGQRSGSMSNLDCFSIAGENLGGNGVENVKYAVSATSYERRLSAIRVSGEPGQ